MAVLGDDFLVDLELQAMQMEGKGEIISSPRVVTADRQEAFIKQGQEIPFQVASQQDAGAVGTVEFKDAVLELRVTPEITPNDGVLMTLVVTRDEPDFTRLVQGNPAINKREISTKVLVNSGETLVLGGAFESETASNQTKVPFLGDLPVIGRLFRSDSKRSSQRELLVFVTPKVLSEGLSVGAPTSR